MEPMMPFKESSAPNELAYPERKAPVVSVTIPLAQQPSAIKRFLPFEKSTAVIGVVSLLESADFFLIKSVTILYKRQICRIPLFFYS